MSEQPFDDLTIPDNLDNDVQLDVDEDPEMTE